MPTLVETYVKDLEPKEAVWKRACASGQAFLARFVGGPVAAIDFALQSREGCADVRWLAVQVFGQRARDAIDAGRKRALARPWRPGDDSEAWDAEFRLETTDEVAGWLRDHAAAWERTQPC